MLNPKSNPAVNMNVQKCNAVISTIKDPNYTYKQLFGLNTPEHEEDYSNDTPLFYACWTNDTNLIQQLIEIQNKAPSNRFADNMVRSLCAACERVHVAAALVLIRNGVDFNREVDGTTPLRYACSRGSYWFARSYLEYGIPIDNLALQYAVVKKNNSQVIGLLHAYGYKVEPQTLMSICHSSNVQFIIDYIPGCKQCVPAVALEVTKTIEAKERSTEKFIPIGEDVDKLSILMANLE